MREHAAITKEAAARYTAGGPVPTSLDRGDRPRLTVAEARAAADGLASGEWPEMEGVREILVDYVEQFEVDEDDELPEDPDPGQED